MRCEVSSASRRQGATSGAGSAVPSGVLEWNFVRPPCSGASVALVLLLFLLLLLLPLTVDRWARLRSPFCSFLSSSRPPGPNHSSLPFLPSFPFLIALWLPSTTFTPHRFTPPSRQRTASSTRTSTSATCSSVLTRSIYSSLLNLPLLCPHLLYRVSLATFLSLASKVQRWSSLAPDCASLPRISPSHLIVG